MSRFSKISLALAIVASLFLVGIVKGGGIYGDGANMFGPVNSTGSWDVSVQDQTTEIIDLHLTRLITAITLTVPFNIDATTASVDSAVLPVAGNMVCFKEDTAFYQAEILTVTATGGTGYDLLLDSPSDYSFSVAGVCSLRSAALNVNGSVTPVIFYASPVGLVDPVNSNKPQKWDIVRVMFQMTDNVSMDDAKFGGLTALANGIIFRKRNGTYKNIFNIKSNADFALHAYDISYSDKAPAGFFGFRSRRTFGGQEKNGVVLRLSAAENDQAQVIVRDDLRGLTKFEAVVQGHIVTD